METRLREQVLLPREPRLSGDWEKDKEVVEKWMRDMGRVVREELRNAYLDGRYFSGQLVQPTAQPTLESLEEGQTVVWGERIWVRHGGVLLTAQLERIGGTELRCRITVT